MTFTPEEAAKIPYGIAESVIQQELDRLSNEIEEHQQALNSLLIQQGNLLLIRDKTDSIKTKYAKGDMK